MQTAPPKTKDDIYREGVKDAIGEIVEWRTGPRGNHGTIRAIFGGVVCRYHLHSDKLALADRESMKFGTKAKFDAPPNQKETAGHKPGISKIRLIRN